MRLNCNVFLFSLALFAGPVRAQNDDVADANLAFMEAFATVCLSNEFRPFLMEEMAEARGWKPLPEHLAKQMVGDWEAVPVKGWLLDAPELAPPFVAFSGTNEEPPKVDMCGAYFPTIDGNVLVAELQNELEAKVVEQGKTDDAITWTLTMPDLHGGVINIIYFPIIEKSGGTVASVTFFRP